MIQATIGGQRVRVKEEIKRELSDNEDVVVMQQPAKKYRTSYDTTIGKEVVDLSD